MNTVVVKLPLVVLNIVTNLLHKTIIDGLTFKVLRKLMTVSDLVDFDITIFVLTILVLIIFDQKYLNLKYLTF